MRFRFFVYNRIDKLFRWILYGPWVFVYGLGIAWPALPAIAAPLLHIARANSGFDGYYTNANWYLLVFILPVAIYLLRVAVRQLSPKNEDGPIVRLFRENQRAIARSKLANKLESGSNLLVALLFMVVVHVVSVGLVLQFYWNGDIPVASGQMDWSVMFLVGRHCFVGTPVIGETANLAFVILAYSAQFATGVIAVLVLATFLRHNLFFVTHVYQRRWARRLDASHLVIDIADAGRNGLFGFGAAIPAFNLQVGVTAIAGVLMLGSRFRHTTSEMFDSLYTLEIKIEEPLSTAKDWIDKLSVRDTLAGDPGQWFLVAMWLLMMFIVSIPAIVKFLPMISGTGPNLTKTEFLKEFFPESVWPGDDRVDGIAKQFARNSFWPTGDGRARWLFMAAFFVLLLLLYPVRPDTGHAPQAFSLYGVFLLTSYAATAVVFWFLRFALAYIHPDLVGQEKDEKD
jgi:hypothetical protein